MYDNPPKIIVDDSGAVSGFHADLLELIAAENGWEVEYVPGTFAEGLESLQSGEIDIMVDVGYSAERERLFVFNDETVLTDWAVIYSRPRFRPTDWSHFHLARVACMEGDIHIDGPMGFRAIIDQLLVKAEFLPVGSYEEAFRMIESGEADIAVVNRVFGALNESKYRVERTPIFFDPVSIRYALKPSRRAEALAAGIDRVLVEMKSDSESVYYGLINEYFITPQERTGIPRWIFFAFGGLLLAVIALTSFLIHHKREIVRRKASEEALARARDQAEEASRAKSEFLANMTHEIRTPMNAVLGYTEILLGDDDLGAKQRKHLEVIHKSGEHLLTMINNILSMSRISSGKLVAEPTSFLIDVLLEDVVDFFAPMADRKGLTVESHHSEDLETPIVGDEGKIRQILINLTGNAVKFTDGGKVLLDARTGMDGNQLVLILSVSDTGPGLPEEDAERIFEPFDQGSVESRREGGTGLGLAISRNLADVMGGELELTANSGEGCTFSLRLPTRRGDTIGIGTQVGRRIVAVEEGFLPLRILVADDKKTNRDIVADILEPLGFDLSFAADGRECLEKYREFSPDLIVLDIRMPVMNGIEVTEAIRKDFLGRKVGILAVSASTLESDKDIILMKGADRFLYKPFRISEFLEAIGSLLGIGYVYRRRSETEETKPPAERPVMESEAKERILAACRIGSRRDVLEILREGNLSDATASDILDRLDRYDFDGIAESLNR